MRYPTTAWNGDTFLFDLLNCLCVFKMLLPSSLKGTSTHQQLLDQLIFRKCWCLSIVLVL